MSYTPSPNTIQGLLLPHLDQMSLRTTALKPLELITLFPKFMKSDDQSAGTGLIAQWYRPQNLTSPTIPVSTTTEGSVGSSLTYSTRTVTVKMQNYSDFLTLSSQVSDISMVNDLEDAAGRMGYYAALIYDLNIRNVVDFEYPGMQRTTLSDYLTIRDLRAGRHYLKNLGVMPPDGYNGNFPTVFSPLVTYDLLADPDAGSVADLLKQQPGVSDSVLMKYNDGGAFKPLTTVAGCAVYESNNVLTTTSSGNTYYSGYLFGDEAFGKVDFAKRPALMKPDSNMGRRFNITVKRTTEASLADPANVIGGFCSFNFWTGAACLADTGGSNGRPGGTYRGIQWRHQSTIS